MINSRRQTKVFIFQIVFSLFIALSNSAIAQDAYVKNHQQVIAAEEFALVDASGKVKAGLSVEKGKPMFYMLDDAQIVRFYITVEPEGGMVVFRDQAQEPRLYLRMEEGGKTTVGFFNQGRKPVMMLTVTKQNEPSLLLYDKAGNARALLAINNGNPGLSFMDSNKRMPLIMQARDGQGALISLQHPGSKRPAVALGVQQGSGFLYALDAQRSGVFAGAQPGRAPALGLLQGGKPLWSALPGGQAPDLPEIERGLDLESLTKGLAR